jgi:hypothetical protein
MHQAYITIGEEREARQVILEDKEHEELAVPAPYNSPIREAADDGLGKRKTDARKGTEEGGY